MTVASASHSSAAASVAGAETPLDALEALTLAPIDACVAGSLGSLVDPPTRARLETATAPIAG
jgi:hypothetical protein